MSIFARTPLLGHKLVRLIYLDEAGTSRKEPALCVAGVLVHGDFESGELSKKLDEIKARHIPEKDRETVIFHATDIFHGSGYFTRDKWPQEKRLQILTDLANIIESMHLPVVAGAYQKATYAAGVIDWSKGTPELKKLVMHAGAAADCAMWADRWLAKYAPSENALITAEDNDYIKKMLKAVIRTLRSPAQIDRRGLGTLTDLGLPLTRIIDTPHFASKQDCPALQLADLCAFIIGRVNKNKDVPRNVAEIIARHLKWRNSYALRVVSGESAS